MTGTDYSQVFNPVLDGDGLEVEGHRHDLYWEVERRTENWWQWYWIVPVRRSEFVYKVSIDNCMGRFIALRRGLTEELVDSTRLRKKEDLANSLKLTVEAYEGDYIVLTDGWHLAGRWQVEHGKLVAVSVPDDVKWRQGPPRLYGMAS